MDAKIGLKWVACALLALSLGVLPVVQPKAKPLPKQFAWTAYGTTSSGYAISVAIGNALSEEGYKLRVIPAKNDISRMAPLKSGRVQFSAMGVGSFLAQEGVLDFGTRKWGPQPVRLLMMAWADTNTALVATAKDAGITSSAKMRNKKIAFVKGGPALNQNMTAWLAHGGLSWDDVKRVEVGGWKASIQGIIDGNIDGAIASTNSSMLHQLANSPRGLHFFPAPHHDEGAWKRLRAHAPWFSKHTATAGVGLSQEVKLEGASFGYPILITYDRLDGQMVYDLVRLIHTKFDSYKNAHSSGAGWDIKRQVFDWILPYDEGAVKYFKEIGVWSNKFEKHNQRLLKRQKVLAKAWKQANSSNKEGPAFYANWMKIRAKALHSAGFEPIWEQ